MTRIIFSNESYHPVDPRSQYETSFQTLLLNHSDILFPDYIALPFTSPVESSMFGSVVADLALIDSEYRDWWVIEVETLDHSISSHVIPQVQRLKTADYPPHLADELAKKNSVLDVDRLRRLFRSEGPRIGVITNGLDSKWIEVMKRFETTLIIVEVFRSRTGGACLRCLGSLPTKEAAIVSELEELPNSQGIVRVKSPGGIAAADNSNIDIALGEYISSWRVCELGKDLLLIPAALPTLKSVDDFRLVRESGGRLRFVNKFEGKLGDN